MKEVFKYVNASQEALIVKNTDSFAIISVTDVLGDEANIFINKTIAQKLIDHLKAWIAEGKLNKEVP